MRDKACFDSYHLPIFIHQSKLEREGCIVVLIENHCFNFIWTGLFANLIRLGGAKMAPLLTWLFQVRLERNLVGVYYGLKSLQIDKTL